MIDAIRALKSGDFEDLQNLLQTFNIHSRDADNNTLLHHACLLGNVEAVRLLLDSGVHANASNIDGQTPICDAALSGSAEIISLLLRSKVDVNPPSYWGSPLIYATQNESINAMRILINAGASLNSPERSGLCPLHIAIQRRFYAGIYLLLSKGADPNCGVRLTTPLHMAAKLNDIDITYLLLEFGASPLSVDKDNHTPIDYVSSTSPVYRLLKSVQNQVPSLQSLSRLAIFSLLRSSKSSLVNELYLPNILKDYVLFRHFHFVTE
ncbi:Ankyrin repeat and SOCS box protein isoform 2 [Schistosoma japonicum]|uniref:Ankyrin repeat and SOCS box protein isoform 2 n=2 Tax=Schistosoma japonicum TaxID=6182 RepID=A0A4Z2DJZ4_SCHJA|nr:Ankyrin repeat and SOCS box protein 13 [Schistosoma japonicum]KAH8859286.1 Ankyrin repeat and SOCS box protein 13 [Schistosoma japonicum]TNN16727.1 Ankyrin repeat and SOCS box protein isoform 2 [Schistosoma japonicum]